MVQGGSDDWGLNEAATAILQDDGRVAGDYSEPNRIKQTVDERHGVSIFVDDREIRCVSTNVDFTGRQR